LAQADRRTSENVPEATGKSGSSLKHELSLLATGTYVLELCMLASPTK